MKKKSNLVLGEDIPFDFIVIQLCSCVRILKPIVYLKERLNTPQACSSINVLFSLFIQNILTTNVFHCVALKCDYSISYSRIVDREYAFLKGRWVEIQL